MAKGPWPSMARADTNLWLRSIVYIFYSYETWCGTATFWSFLHLGFVYTCAYTFVCPSRRLWLVTTWSFVHCGFEIRQLIEQQSILTTEKPLKKFLFHQFNFLLMAMLRGAGDRAIDIRNVEVNEHFIANSVCNYIMMIIEYRRNLAMNMEIS